MIRHPAKFSPSIIEAMRPWVPTQGRVLDPMAGTGRLAWLRPDAHLNELEPEWAALCATKNPEATVTLGDARDLPYPDGYFDAVVTSPTYGNRMADHHEAKDDSRRNTYRHTLGRALTEGNTGQLQWGEEYRMLHLSIWAEAFRVLAPGGHLVLNVSDHIRKGEHVFVTYWHCQALQAIGFRLLDSVRVETPRNGMGANGKVRVGFESVLLFEKWNERSGAGVALAASPDAPHPL